MSPLVEKLYLIAEEEHSDNLPPICFGISSERYSSMEQRFNTIYNPPVERGVGNCVDETNSYVFSGRTAILDNGIAQVGTAETADNTKGFHMTRLFAKSLDDMAALEAELGLLHRP